MLITMLADRFDAGGVLRARGTQVDVADSLAFTWIGQGAAAPVGNAREFAEKKGGTPVLQDLSGNPFTVRATAGAAAIVSRPRKQPIAQVGGGASISLSDITVLAGSPTVTVEPGPNGAQAIKLVTGVGANAEIAFPGLVGARFDGEAYLCMHGSYTQGNLDYVVLLMSQDDATYAKGTNTIMQYGQTNPLQTNLEQGGANTYWWRKGGQGNLATGPTYPATIGQIKLRIVPRAGLAATVYIYGFSLAAPQAKGRICTVWDDGYKSMFDLGYDIFASRGIKQTLSVIGSAQDSGGSYSSTAHLQAFVAAGNALVAHGPWPNQGAGNLYSAYPGSLNPVQDAIEDMKRHRQWLADRGLLVPFADRCFVWPQGQFQASANDTTLLDAALAAGFTLGRGTSNLVGTSIYPQGVQIDALSKYNRLACPIIGHLWAGTTAAETTNITNVTTAISNLAASRGDAFLMLHRVMPHTTNDAGMGTSGNVTIRQGDLDTIAAAIKTQVDAGTLETVTMPELAADTWWRQF